MSLHDAYARLTPFEIAFPDAARFDRLLSAVADESARVGIDVTNLDAFATLAAVGDFLTELHGADVPRVELIQHGVLLFHAVHFARALRPLYLVDAEGSRVLVRAAPPPRPDPPTPAGYLQLPQHLFWTGAAEGAAPESVDGLFWTVSGADRLHVLPVVGLRPDRPGFGALSLPDVPLTHATEWLHAAVRDGGADYASNLPGAGLDELYSVESAGEVLKLLARFFAHASATPTPLEARVPARGAGGPRPSALPYSHVKLVA